MFLRMIIGFTLSQNEEKKRWRWDTSPERIPRLSFEPRYSDGKGGVNSSQYPAHIMRTRLCDASMKNFIYFLCFYT